MFPRLITARLVLDAFTLADVPVVVEFCRHPEIYATTLLIERPYLPEHASNWINTHESRFLSGGHVNFAVRTKGKLIGSFGLIIKRNSDQGEFGYWIGRPYWNQGYATEAMRAVLAYGFQHRALEKIEADHFASNTASGRVMEKAGLTREGFRPHHFKKDGVYIDAVLYGITRTDALAKGLITGETTSTPPAPRPAPTPVRTRHPSDPPFIEELIAEGTSTVSRSLVQRHFLGKSVAELEAELRVYGKSLAPDFAHLAPVALGYYLTSARQYLESEFSEGDWDFAHGLVAALALQLRDTVLPLETRLLAQTLVQHVRDHASRYFIEADKQPFAGWVAEALVR